MKKFLWSLGLYFKILSNSILFGTLLISCKHYFYTYILQLLYTYIYRYFYVKIISFCHFLTMKKKKYFNKFRNIVKFSLVTLLKPAYLSNTASHILMKSILVYYPLDSSLYLFKKQKKIICRPHILISLLPKIKYKSFQFLKDVTLMGGLRS